MHQISTSTAVFSFWEPSGELIVNYRTAAIPLNKRDLRCFEPAQYITRFKRAKEHKSASSRRTKRFVFLQLFAAEFWR